MANEPQIGFATGAGHVDVEKVTFPYRAVQLRFQLQVGQVRIPFRADEARWLGETMIQYADELSAGGTGDQE
jgi:hypothetical protein